MNAPAGQARGRARPVGAPGWLRAGVIVGVLALAFVVSRSCQQSQVRVTKEQALASAERQVDFEPTREQIRFLRQGLNSQPVWIVSLSVPREGGNAFSELAVVRIHANTGKVLDVKTQRKEPASP